MDQLVSLYSSSKKIADLPVVVIEKIVNYLSFEEMSHVRQSCKLLQKFTERALNEGFFLLGRQVAHSSTNVKKQLPKKESERRAHPLNRYSEIFSALETRYTLLSMTYKKFIDLRHCCFIPGKVLDVAFAVVRQINNYLAQNTTVALDVIEILRDVRDYSSMAMEHFDEHIAPHYPSRSLIPLFRPCSNIEPSSFVSQCCTITLTSARKTGCQPEEDLESHSAKDFQELRNEMRSKFEEQNRIIDEQRKVIKEQGFFIREIVEFLEEMGKQNEWTPKLMSNLNRLSSNYSSIGTGPSTITIDVLKPKKVKQKKNVFSKKTTLKAPTKAKVDKSAKPYFLRDRSHKLNEERQGGEEERNLRLEKRKALLNTLTSHDSEGNSKAGPAKRVKHGS